MDLSLRYLTQKISEAVRKKHRDGTAITTQEDVESLVEQMFFSPNVIHEDPNLSFVRDWLTCDRGDSWQFLRRVAALYAKVYYTYNQPVIEDLYSLEQAKLKLSGLIKRREDHILCVRNLIYKRVFTTRWIAGESGA